MWEGRNLTRKPKCIRGTQKRPETPDMLEWLCFDGPDHFPMHPINNIKGTQSMNFVTSMGIC